MKSLCFVAILFFFSTCKKTSNEPVLPAVTHSGKEIIAFRVNGKVVVISGNKRTSFNNTLGVSCFYFQSSDLIIDGSTQDKMYGLRIVFKFNNSPGKYNITGDYPYEGSFEDYRPSTVYLNPFFSVNAMYKGTININYFENGICSGVFAFDAVNIHDSIVHITDGRFDISLN